MNLQTFFDNFELLAEAPNGVQKLRELILQLAVMGKLAPQDPNDEPASVLLKKIKFEKELLVKKGNIAKERSLLSIQKNQIPYNLPEGWECVRLGDICCFLGGYAFKSNSYVETSNNQVVRLGNIKNNRILLEQSPVYVPDKIAVKNEKFLVCEGDILITMTGTIKKRDYCFTAIVDNNHLCNRNLYLNQRVGCLRVIKPTLIKLVNIFLKSHKILDLLFLSETGTANQGNIGADALKNLPFPLPPLAEQRRIVTKVDQLMKLCEELEARQQKKREARVTINNTAIAQLLTAREPEEFNKSWQRIYSNFDLLYSTPENIAKLRSCILQLAVMGKLAPQNSSEEPASVLLEKIKVEKELLISEGEIKKEKPFPTILVEQQPYEIPQGWRWIRLADISKTIEYGTSEKSLDIGNVPIFRMNNIRDGKILFDNLKYVNDSIKDLPRLYLQDNDLLFNRTNSYELVGKTGVFRGESYKYTFASYLIRISLFSEYINPELINMVMNSYYFRQTQIEPEITQQCGQANFNGTKLKNTIIPLPPLAEQNRIIAKVKQLMTLCDQLDAQLKQSIADSEKLMETAVRQLLDINTITADDICVEPTTLETKTVKQSSKKTQSHGGEAIQLNLQLF